MPSSSNGYATEEDGLARAERYDVVSPGMLMLSSDARGVFETTAVSDAVRGDTTLDDEME